MKFLLINPNWSFDGSIYFGCRDPHLPLELGYSAALLKRRGHETLILDAHLFNLSPTEVRQKAEAFSPDMVVITTAPTYLFWRCPPPELKIPQALVRTLRSMETRIVAVGPHGSTVPRTVLKKMDVDVVVMGECEEVLPHLAEKDWRDIPSIAYASEGRFQVQGPPAEGRFYDLPPLTWPVEWIERHQHHHHRFDAHPGGPGAEVEASRGCPYSCTFCAKKNFRGTFRKRPLSVILAEIDHLQEQGVEYVYFVDEIFLPDENLLSALAARHLKFGIQTRIDLWSPSMLELLGSAGCRSIEAGVESITPSGRRKLGKPGRLGTTEITRLLGYARRHVPFVQANLLRSEEDSLEKIAAWRQELQGCGVWANDPVPLFPYPGSGAYQEIFGHPDDTAYEKAHAWYLNQFDHWSDLQAESPCSLQELESTGGAHG